MATEDNKWKDFILKSGLPLEFEVKKTLKKFGFESSYEYSYVRPNENNIPTEFSFDIDSYKFIGNHCFELLVECKYRHESTNWIFLPEDYNKSGRGVGTTSFLNTNDFFYSKKFIDYYELVNIHTIAPLCSKGIEICTDNKNPKTITQAVSQLCYGMISKVISGMKDQLNDFGEQKQYVFHHIPIIVTTANLYRLHYNVTTSSIKNSTSIESIADKEYILLLEPNIGKELENYTYKKLAEFINEFTIEKLNANLSEKKKLHNWNFSDYQKIISQELPKGILIIQHEPENKGFNIISEILSEIARPSKKYKELDKFIKNWKKTIED